MEYEEPVPESCRIVLHGIAVEVRWDHPEVARALRLVFDYFGFVVTESEGPSPESCLAFLTNGRLPGNGERDPASPRDDVTFTCEGDVVHVRDGASHVVLDLPAGTGLATIAAPLWSGPGVLRIGFVHLVVHSLLLLLQCEGLHPLHAAALADRDVGLLLVAPGDSGKSTQAMGLVRNGWQYLSDDSVVLRLAGAGVEVLALRRDFGLDAQAEATFPEIAGFRRPFVTDERKRRVDVDVLFPGRRLDHMIPRLLLLPEIAPHPQSRLEPASRLEAMSGLMRQSPLLHLCPRLAGPHMLVLKRLAEQTTPFRLFAGRDLLENPERLAVLLAPAVASLGGATAPDGHSA